MRQKRSFAIFDVTVQYCSGLCIFGKSFFYSLTTDYEARENSLQVAQLFVNVAPRYTESTLEH